MKIRYNKTLGIIGIIEGIILLIAIFLIIPVFLINPLWIIIVSIVLLIGISLLTRTYFVVEQDRLIINALVGPLKRTIKFSSFEELRTEKDKIYLERNNERKRIQVSKFLANREDWNIFINKIKSTH